MTKLGIEIWSDIACPWCYVGKRRFEAALARFEHRDDVEVKWRSFELDPSAPRIKDGTLTYAERLAGKYSTSLEQAEQMIRTMTDNAAGDGLDFHFERIRPGNTFDAHRLVHFADTHGKQGEAKERLFRAYLTDGEAIGDRDVLVRLASELGLDGGDVREMLEGDTFEREVRDDEELARSRGISGVPFFLVAGRFGASGAQPPELLLRALEQAWRELAVEPAQVPPEAGTCGPEGCA